jgi:hypothetical protein
MSDPICIQWKTAADGLWSTAHVSGLPVTHNVKIRIECFGPPEFADCLEDLVAEIRDLIGKIQGKMSDPVQWAKLDEPASEDNLLEALVSDGKTAVPLEDRFQKALKAGPRHWVLPMMSRKGASVATLPDALQRQNIAFWNQSIKELALTVLGRSGVTSLDRRVFISYRRTESEPMARQLFNALERRNFSVFLDTVSIDPGVDFQARLFESLADKSMVLLLHSRTFSESRWTMEEVDYAHGNDLSVFVLKFPDVAKDDPLTDKARSGEVLALTSDNLVSEAPGPPSQDQTPPPIPPRPAPPFRLAEDALLTVIDHMIQVHDKEMVARLSLMRSQTFEALALNAVNHRPSKSGASIYAESAPGPGRAIRTYSLFPTSRPPGVPELFDASTRTFDVGDTRIVVGRIFSYNQERLDQMKWTVNGRNVTYIDISMLDNLASDIKNGAL